MTTSEQPLTDYALRRLQSLAKGNGVTPDSLRVRSTEEKIVTVTGSLLLQPTVETTQQVPNPKTLRTTKEIPSFASTVELSNFIAEEQQKFIQDRKSWSKEVLAELEQQKDKGWGLRDTRIVLDQRPALQAMAVETCSYCNGQGGNQCDYCAGVGQIPCRQCGQSGSENCFNCFGTGRNPQDQNSYCPVCNGTRLSVCRICQGRRATTCNNCRGSGNLICSPCRGAGSTTQLATLSFGAEAHFGAGSTIELPSALRRALDRAGSIKMLAAHAEIATTVPADEDQPRNGAMKLDYTATLPCAEIVMEFDGTPARIVCFGTKRNLLEVPAFLEQGLAEGLSRLEKAARGQAALEPALEFRALKEVCGLVLQGKTSPKDLRRLYPYGISPKTLGRILQQLSAALDRSTQLPRLTGLGIGVAISAALTCLFYLTPIHAQILAEGGRIAALMTEFFIPVLCGVLSALLTGQLAQQRLMQRFPEVKLRRRYHGGIIAWIAGLLGFLIPFVLCFVLQIPAYWRIWLGI
jgi:hypothetical protein